jgi:hypothetical protein
MLASGVGLSRGTEGQRVWAVGVSMVGWTGEGEGEGLSQTGEELPPSICLLRGEWDSSFALPGWVTLDGQLCLSEP